eukprot:8972913-Alexandrium_andersonii.AAC.1
MGGASPISPVGAAGAFPTSRGVRGPPMRARGPVSPPCNSSEAPLLRGGGPGDSSGPIRMARAPGGDEHGAGAVSYTHLTLPTICSV